MDLLQNAKVIDEEIENEMLSYEALTSYQLGLLATRKDVQAVLVLLSGVMSVVLDCIEET